MLKHIGFAAVVATAIFTGPASAAVRYDFMAFNSLDNLPQLGAISGAFTYLAPTFITSDTSLPAASLSNCTFKSTAGPAICASADFDPNGLADHEVVGFYGNVSGLLGGVNFVFDKTAFVTPGTHATDGGVQEGALIVSFLPEPAIWTVVFLGLGLMGATIRRRHAAIRRLSKSILADHADDHE